MKQEKGKDVVIMDRNKYMDITRVPSPHKVWLNLAIATSFIVVLYEE